MKRKAKPAPPTCVTEAQTGELLDELKRRSVAVAIALMYTKEGNTIVCDYTYKGCPEALKQLHAGNERKIETIMVEEHKGFAKKLQDGKFAEQGRVTTDGEELTNV